MSMINLNDAMPSNKNTTIAEYVGRLTGYTVLVRGDATTGVLVNATINQEDPLEPKGQVVTGCAWSLSDLTEHVSGPMPWAVVEVLSTETPMSVNFLEVSYVDAVDALKHLADAGNKKIVGLARKDNLSGIQVKQYRDELMANPSYYVVNEISGSDHVNNFGIYCTLSNKQRGLLVLNTKYPHRNKLIMSATDASGLAAAINYLK